MPIQVSPGVVTQEIDLTGIVPAQSTSIGALAGVFNWGPVGEAVLISSEPNLVQRFGKPSDFNAETWFTAANFLAYSSAMFVSRAADANTYNAVAATTTVAPIQITNKTDYDTTTLPSGGLYGAKFPGLAGNSLRVSICDSAAAFSGTIGAPLDANNAVEFQFNPGSTSGILTVTNSSVSNASATSESTAIIGKLAVGDRLLVGNTTTGKQYVKVVSLGTPVVVNAGVAVTTIGLDSRINTNANVQQSIISRTWEYASIVNAAPGTSDFVAAVGGTSDEMHLVVVDQDGVFSGEAGTVLEVFQGMSRATDAKVLGSSNYYKNVVNGGSAYVWWMGDSANAPSSVATTVAASSSTAPISIKMVGGTNGADESTVSVGVVTSAYSSFASAEEIDVSLLMTGKSIGGESGELLANYLIGNIAEVRKDCVVFLSPARSAVVNNVLNQLESIITFRDLLTSSSYGFMDSGYKYQYDKYNDVYRWVPLNGDIAGLAARTDQTNDPWFAPAGFNRGQLKNVVKLAYNPSQMADRDGLYKVGINPVVTFAGQGTVLYGQKTLQTKPSAFDRLNVRRLFIVLEKAISTASKYSLFEFNDSFTRANFVNMVEPFMRDVKGRRGVYDFKVVCDETNNTPQVIDSNRFIGAIYIKPTRVAEFITLQFIAVATGVDFTTAVGQA